jgi:glucose/arabinose dehydrogenase
MTRRRSTTLLAVIAGTATLAACAADPPDARPPGPSVSFATSAPPTAAPTSEPPAPPTSNAPGPSSSAPAATTTTEPLGDPVVALETIGSFDQPVDLAWRIDDPTLFVAERVGTVVTWRDGTIGPAVLDVAELTDAEGEQGLLGLAFASDGRRAYINHTDRRGDTVVAEYVVGDDGVFDTASRRVLLTIDQPYANHNGGNLTVGPDGLLYIGMGDGGAAGDPQRYALDLGSLLGKILRIDPTPSGDQPYTVPADNPFVGVAGARGEIWSVGVRNPWRFSFDRQTGDLWVADVGQNEIEEVSLSRRADGAGRAVNFGWSAFEGSRRYNEDQPVDGATPPVFEYEHGDAGCSVSGGAVYRGNSIAELVGWYVLADFCSGVVTGLRLDDAPAPTVLELARSSSVTAVREGPDGELYVLSIEGDVARIVAG